MIEFVNAKINIGLNIVGKRADGYHLLETIFYPVGVHNGLPSNPSPFCDVLELSERSDIDPDGYEENGVRFLFSGNDISCPPEKNLVVKGVRTFCNALPIEDRNAIPPLTMRVKKHIPDGAGMGGGSSDAVAAMKLMRSYAKKYGLKSFGDAELESLALTIGADCPFFVKNSPAFGEGIGEKLTPVISFLKGMWLVVVKPDLCISTAEAFDGIAVNSREENLVEMITHLPMREWKDKIKNDFEDSLFPKFPVLAELKDALYENGADYASLTGSGAALYGIFSEKTVAERASTNIDAPYHALLLL